MGARALTIGLESMGLPLPGETILVMASLHAGHRGESIAPVIAAAVAGAIIGDNIGLSTFRVTSWRWRRKLRGFSSDPLGACG